MVDIKKIKPEIIELLMPLKPDKIILFGSYAYGTPNEDSDIDLFLVKDDLTLDDMENYEIEAHMRMYELIKKYHIGFDLLSASTEYLNNRDDYFFKVDILQKGKVWHE